LYDFLAWLEASALGHAVRGAGVWAYGILNLTHILGVATLFGSMLLLDLRLLGVWPGVSAAALARPTVPLAAAGFAVAVLSGTCMIATNATDYASNPFIYIKFPAIALGLLNVLVVTRLSAWKTVRRAEELSLRARRQLAAAGGVSLACWLTAISAGRMIGYW
jgi:hypothetical protein